MATARQWAETEGKSPNNIPALRWSMSCCLLELRARVEALEEAKNNRRFNATMAAIDAATPEQIRAAAGLPESSSLVERVASAIHQGMDLDLEARAAIREVAAWLEDENADIGMGTAGNIAERLREEADRG